MWCFIRKSFLTLLLHALFGMFCRCYESAVVSVLLYQSTLPIAACQHNDSAKKPKGRHCFLGLDTGTDHAAPQMLGVPLGTQ